MNDTLIRRVNKLDRHDVLFHVGDFVLVGHDRHGIKEDFSDIKYSEYLDKIKPHIILLNGNHDSGHNVKAMLNSAVVNLNRKYKNISVSHFPLTHENYKSYSNKIHIHLCGHVHDKWLMFFDVKAGILNYNVGVDCHNYNLVKDSQIIEDLDFIFTYHDFNQSWKMTVQNMIELKTKIKVKLNNDREKRKQERYHKKGLTEAECLRRKEEALRKKGILK